MAKVKKKTEIDYSKPLKNWQYEQFCKAHLATNNATQAAKDAKYSAKTAGSKGTQLLQIVSIAGRLKYLRAKVAKKYDITADRVISELAKIAFANIKSVLGQNNAIMDLSELPDEITAPVESIQSDIRYDGGDSKGYTEKVKVKFCSKLGALGDLGRQLGIFGEDNQQSRPLTQQIICFGNIDDSKPTILRSVTLA